MGGLDKTARNKRLRTSSKAAAFLQTKQVVDSLSKVPESLSKGRQKVRQQ